ncbi:MAG: hypothetical protein HY000_02720 [Planctomycetes bacterium]|nr:hypothetical protein [Planctomycetota bacterium]
MIEKVIEYSVRNPVIVIILALVVAGVGVYSVTSEFGFCRLRAVQDWFDAG